eukprot:gene7691-9003_t
MEVAGGEKMLQWRRNAWNNCTSLYGELVDLCVKDTHLAALLDSAEVDAFAKNIVNIFSAASKTLPLIKELIYNEFNSKVMAEGEGSILRGNNIVNKIEGAYVRLVGANYLRHVLTDLVTRVVLDKDLRLEIDPRKLTAYNEDDEGNNEANITNPDIAIAENKKRLFDVAQAFIDRITDPAIIEDMPREIRAVADYTAESALKYAPESLAPLVGGFIMLRFFSPAIVTPEYSKLIAPEIVPSRRAKRNLVLLAKVLQNASNGVMFGVKEDFMTCMNSFVSDNKEKMTRYFKLICIDPLAGESKQRRWSDLQGVAPFVMGTKPTTAVPSPRGSAPSANKWTVTTPSTYGPGQTSSSASASKTRVTPPVVVPAAPIASALPCWDNYIRNIEMGDLFDLHRILDLYKDKIASKMSITNRSAVRVLELLRELGPSPKTKIEKKRKEEVVVPDDLTLTGGVSLNAGFDDLTFQLERARFLFQGPNDKHDRPVFYLIVNRVKAEVFDNVNPLIAHIFKVMDSCVNLSSYTLIVDMSWAHISNDMRRAIFTHLPKLAEVFSRKYKKNIDRLFIVHPSAYTRAVIYFMRAFTSRKLKRKIHEVYNWKQLQSFIDTENIALPETSKDYITKSYRVVKVNSKGKRQERLIKFTSNSLLNIDPKTKRVQNEKKLDEIDEISSALGSIEISMKFRGGAGASAKRIGFLTLGGGKSSPSAPSTALDSSVRKYVCNHELERDHIIQDIFEAGFKMGLSARPPSPTSTFTAGHTLPTEYRVIKVNNAGKHQERVFKLTIDSLLNLDQQRIKSENSFAGIEEVVLDFENSDIVWMKYKSEPHKRKVICREGEGRQLFEVLTEAIHKYQKSIDIQEGDLKLAAEESAYY